MTNSSIRKSPKQEHVAEGLWEIHVNESTIQQRQIWLIVDSWIRNNKERIPRSQALSINASNNVSQSTWYVERIHKEWFVRNYSGKMVHRCRLSKVVIWWRLNRRKSDNSTNLPWETILMELRLQKSDDVTRTGQLFSTEEYKVR